VSCSVNKNIPEQVVTPAKKHIIKKNYFEENLKQWNKARNSVLILVPMSGENVAIGRGIINACLLSANDASDIDFYVENTHDVDMSKLYEKFKEHNFDAIIGPVFYNEVGKYEALFRHTPIFSLSNNISINNQHVIACGLSPQEEIKKICLTIKASKLSGVLLLVPENSYANKIVQLMRQQLVKIGFNEENDVDIIRYKSITKDDATRIVQTSNRRAVFVVDPILNIDEIDDKFVFTLSSSVLNNRENWNGVIFAFDDNLNRKKMVNLYTSNFKSTPTIIDIVAYDILNAIISSIKNHTALFGTKFSGCLGNFEITKKNGIVRDLNLYKIESDELVRLEKEE